LSASISKTARPFLPADQRAPNLTAQQAHDEVLDAEDVLGKRIITTRLRGSVTVREAQATAALEDCFVRRPAQAHRSSHSCMSEIWHSWAEGGR
jgi:hypothetical protein